MKGLSKGRYDETFAGEDGNKIDNPFRDLVTLLNDVHFNVAKRWQNLLFYSKKCSFK